MLAPDDLAKWRELFDEISKRPNSKVGLMKLGSSVPGDRIYAVPVRDSGLWLTLWVRRSWKSEFFVFMPRADGNNPHASYHRDGTFHHKSGGFTFGTKKLQRLDKPFKVTEHLSGGADTVQKASGLFAIPTFSLGWSSFRPACWVLAMGVSSSTSSNPAAILYGGPAKWSGRRYSKMPCRGL